MVTSMSVEKLRKVVEILKRDEGVSPTKIASEIGSDRRTVGKILEEGTKMKMIKCNIIEISGRQYASCKLTEEYKKILEKGE